MDAMVAGSLWCVGLHLLQVVWCLYTSLLCAFHLLEFLSTALFQPDSLSYDCKHACHIYIVMLL